ncbi:MAG: Amuc_1099 family pilus-like system protein [Chthoniobacterales bacterium]
MDWFKKHYDRVILAGLGLLLTAVAAFIILNALSFGEVFDERNSRKPPSAEYDRPDVEAVQAEIDSVTDPAQWGAGEGSLFVSKPYVLREGELINPLAEGSSQLHPPVDNEWLVKYDLDYARGDILQADPDGDKFSNLEEFNAGTDPTTEGSQPPYITKLRLKEFIQIPFRLKFSGSPDNGETFTINTRDLKGATKFVKLGDMIEGSDYKVTTYEKKTRDKNGLQLNVSELTVENQETGEKIVLVYDEEINYPTGFALFSYLWDGSEQKVKKNDSFSVAPEPDVKYKLIDISATEALIQRASSGEEITVPALQE